MTDHPVAIGQFALACWNAYLTSHEESPRLWFLHAARWYIATEYPVTVDAGEWTIPALSGGSVKQSRSASSQGIGLSVLMRAYQLTGSEVFLDGAGRAARQFDRDVLDGGLSVPIGEDGVFFEEDACYPASYVLHGHLFGLLGLHDFWSITSDAKIGALVERGIRALRMLLRYYDSGHWSRYDLRHSGPASPFYQSLHAVQLEALAAYTGSMEWATVAARWTAYQLGWKFRARQLQASFMSSCALAIRRRLATIALGHQGVSTPTKPERVIVPVTAFPISGGIRAVLAGVDQAMRDEWRMEYLARDVAPHDKDLVVHRFGSKVASPWQFPTVWLYVAAGAIQFLRLLRREYPYRLILPQDSVFTGAFAALVGRLAGARVVSIEHGTITFPFSSVYRAERLNAIPGTHWHRRLAARLQLSFYWPSLRVLSWIAVHCTDHFLVAGQESADVYLHHLGVPLFKITRWRFMMDMGRYTPPDPEARVEERARLGIDADAILVSIVARLSPAKGLDVALEGIERALWRLPAELRRRVRVVIAGDGPLRSQVEGAIARLGLSGQCVLLGEKSAEEVVRLLGITDVFLYSSIRGTNYSMAILEAMASGCAVVASTEPRSNEELLADGRGIAIPSGDLEALSNALVSALGDLPGCRRMGRLARAYISDVHTERALKRALLRACGSPPGSRSPPPSEGQDKSAHVRAWTGR